MARTSGWIANIGGGLTKEEHELYKNTCYTDGICYQNSHTMAIADYGCIDANRKQLDTHFHDATAKVCQNGTVGKGKMAWICCQNYHFCANSTNLVADEHVAGSVKYWAVLMSLIAMALLVIILILIGNLLPAAKRLARRWWKKNKIFGKYEQQQDSEVDSIRLSETSDHEKLLESESKRMTSEKEQVNTMSTLVSEEPVNPHDPLPDVPLTHQSKLMIKKVNKLLDFIDETSGSGKLVEEGGLGRLHEKSLTERTILGHNIGGGRFGSVFVGLLDGERVAVKIMKSDVETMFTHEVKILIHPYMRHKNFLLYHGATRKEVIGNFDNWIITEYHEKGSLYEYLLHNTIDLETFYKMTTSIIDGLKYLHNERKEDANAPKWDIKNGKKPDEKNKMAHRDIKTRNILVKSDNTCCLADFGLTIIAPKVGEPIPESIVKNFKCGTVRYLAPEILNGTMESHIFDSFIMADVYAFSLVMWETLSRTSHQEIIAREPDMAVPYVEWTDRDPKDAIMESVVCTQKLRPKLGEMWKSNEDFKPLLEIMSICWNANPSARYTSTHLLKKIQILEQGYLEKIDPSLKEIRLKAEAEEEMWKRKHVAQQEEKLRRGHMCKENAIVLNLDFQE